jgi:hypothetical protein
MSGSIEWLLMETVGKDLFRAFPVLPFVVFEISRVNIE